MRNLYRKILFSILTASTLLFLVLFIKIGFLALILGIVLLLIIFFAHKPEIGVYLMAFLLPSIYISINLMIVDKALPLIDVVSLLVLVGYLSGVMYKNIFTDKKEKIDFPVLIPFLTFFLVTLLTSLLSENALSSLWFSFRYILGFYLLYVVLPFNVLKDSIDKIKICLGSFVFSASLLAVSSVAFFALDWPQEFFRLKPINFVWQDRIINFFESHFGGLIEIYPFITEHTLFVETLLPALFFTVVLKRITKNERLKRFLNLTMSFIFVVLVGTFSRGAWLSLIVCFLSFLIYRMFSQRKNLKKYIFIGFITLIVASPFFFHMYKLQTTQAIGGSSNSNRILSIQIAVNAFQEKIFLGHGGGTYIEKIAADEDYIQKFGNPVDALGIWQKILVEYGLGGILTFMFFVISILMIYLKVLKKYKEKEKLLITMMLATVGIFFFEFFNTSYYTGKLWLPIGMTLAMIVFLKQEKYEK